jgi:hypothetical protein
MHVQTSLVSMLPHNPLDKHMVYSYLETLFGAGINGGLIDDYISIMLSGRDKQVDHINYHLFEYGDVGLKRNTMRIPHGCCRKVRNIYPKN